MLMNNIATRQLQEIVDLRPGYSMIVDQPQGEAALIKLKVEDFVHTVLYLLIDQSTQREIDLEQMHLNDPDGKYYAVIEFKDHDPSFSEVTQTLKYFNSYYEINSLKNLSNPSPYTVDLSQLEVQLPKLHIHTFCPNPK